MGLTNAYREVNPRPRHVAFSEILMGMAKTSLECDPAMRKHLQSYLDRPYDVIFPEGYTEEEEPDPASYQTHGESFIESIMRKEMQDREKEGRE